MSGEPTGESEPCIGLMARSRGCTAIPIHPVCVVPKMIDLRWEHSKLQGSYGFYESLESKVAHRDSKLAICAEDKKLSATKAQLVLTSCTARGRRRPSCELESVRRSNYA